MIPPDPKDPPIEAILATFPASDSVSPFVPARGAMLDDSEVESVRISDSEVEPSMAPNADVENVSESPPEQIDPGADGKAVI